MTSQRSAVRPACSARSFARSDKSLAPFRNREAAHRILMYRFESYFARLVDHRHERVEPIELGLQMLVNQHQRFNRPPHVTIA